MWIDLAKYSKAHLPLNSEEVKGWWSKVQESSSLTIKIPLTPDTWQYLMRLLAQADVSGIERVELIDHSHISGWVELETDPCSDVLIGFGSVLGRFSALTTLKIATNSPDMLSALGLESRTLAAAFRTGQLTNLLYLDIRVSGVDDFSLIFEALVAGGISKLIEFSIRVASSRLEICDQKIIFQLQYESERYYRFGVAQKLDALLKAGCFKNLQYLDLRDHVVDGVNEWRVFANAINSGLLPNTKRLFLINNELRNVDLADLVGGRGNWLSSLEQLTIQNCAITSEQVCAMVDAIMKFKEIGLALNVLNLSSNNLEDSAVPPLASLLESGHLSQLQELNLSGNRRRLSSVVFSRLIESIRRSHLQSLKKLYWTYQKGATNEVAEVIAQAYFENDALTADINIDWGYVEDSSLEAKAKEYKERNLRLVSLRNKLEEEFKVLVPLSRAKVFLCGFPEVGKTTLRKSLERHLGLWTKLKWETRPRKEPRTKGIELSRIQDKKNTTLVFWDLAGQEEFHVLHGTFLADLGFAGGKATTFVLVFRARFEANVHKKLLYWLKFVASSCVKYVKRHVMIVLNCFGGKQCRKNDKRCWISLIQDVAAKFSDLLYIHPDPFIIDARVATLVKPLKDQLFDQARALLQDVEVQKVCFELLKELKRWSERENKSSLPIFSWQAFEEGLAGKHYHTKNLKIWALYLHEIGEIIYFDRKESTQLGFVSRSIVVPDPQWFCRQVVGHLLLPKDMLEGGSSIEVSDDGSISLIWFQAFFQHLLPEGTHSDDVISMLEQMGLCYRKGTEEIIVPALICEDDYNSIEWEGKGLDGVMGRSLATEDKDRCAIPGTLFRQLQVELAQDPNLGGRGDSKYRAGKSFSSFKVGELLVLIQFDEDHSDPNDDRIDILVKSLLDANSFAQVNCICRIMQKVEKLCVTCCPGLKYDIKVMQPWNATNRTPRMTERQLMPATEMKALLAKGHKYSSWELNGHPAELKTFLSEGELEWVLGSGTVSTFSDPSFVPMLKQLDDMVYEVYSPLNLEMPELEVVFFHGLQLKYGSQTYVSTWTTRDNSQLWLQTWLVKEFPGARILIVSYDSSAKKTSTDGRMDMYVIAENLLCSLTSNVVNLGQSGRPVVLVGHCIGGLVMKELSLSAEGMLSRMNQGRLEMEKICKLVTTLQGFFFYGTPQSGSAMVDQLQKYIQVEGPLLEEMEMLKASTARRNWEFEQLRKRHGWLTRGVGESRETFLEFLGKSIHVVPEGSARRDMDMFRTDSEADHFDVCKPVGSRSSSFQFLVDFLRQIRDA